MNQSALHSALESILNTASGWVLSVAAGEFIFPVVGLPISHSQNVAAVSLFTIISVIRSYAWRRLFNHIHRNGWL